jgi:hypothetical protein
MLCKKRKDTFLKLARDQCAARLAAIEFAGVEWARLRETELATAELSAALTLHLPRRHVR